jgi:hypothetical protein
VKHNNDKLLKLLKEILKINRNDTVTIQNVANGQTPKKYKSRKFIATANGLLSKSNLFCHHFFKAVEIAVIIQSQLHKVVGDFVLLFYFALYCKYLSNPFLGNGRVFFSRLPHQKKWFSTAQVFRCGQG